MTLPARLNKFFGSPVEKAMEPVSEEELTRLVAGLRARFNAQVDLDKQIGRKPQKETLDTKAADALVALQEEMKRLRSENANLLERVKRWEPPVTAHSGRFG